MTRKNRKITQITLISLGFFLIAITYFFYPIITEKKYENVFIKEKKNIQENDEISVFENMEYEGFYSPTSPFTVKAKNAYILDENPEIVHMLEMHVSLYVKDGRIITITSKKGRYNKTTYDCYFEENVKATDTETVILSENLDLMSANETASAYNDVVLTNEKGSLQADRVDYNFETRYYKISMYNNNKVKVKLIKWLTKKNLE